MTRDSFPLHRRNRALPVFQGKRRDREKRGEKRERENLSIFTYDFMSIMTMYV